METYTKIGCVSLACCCRKKRFRFDYIESNRDEVTVKTRWYVTFRCTLCTNLRKAGRFLDRIFRRHRNRVGIAEVDHVEEEHIEDGLQEFTDAFVEEELNKISCMILAVEDVGTVVEDIEDAPK